MEILKESMDIFQVVLYAYVLMDNHFHLVLQTGRANLSEFMRRFNICYTGWFNYRHKTCGHLYQGRCKALLVDADNYLLTISRYVHLNPIRVRQISECDFQKKWQYLLEYRWSSLSGYLHISREVAFIDYNMILEMIGGRHAYKKFLFDGIKSVENIYKDVQYQTILGDSNFVTLVKEKYLSKGSPREQPLYRALLTRVIEPEVVIVCCAEVFGVKSAELRSRAGNGIMRGIVAEMLYRYSGITQRAIGELLGGIEYTAISMLRCRLQKKINKPEISVLYAKVESRLNQLCEG